ncbi:MAG: GDP-mannose 4,6-dehydratase [Actinomycetales bacterium]|nr:GDP-mannose 4,6-dehydratase [Actinomycetales bacterium]
MRALITGAAGQDGTILATLLAREGADVFGLVKPGTETQRLLRYVPSLQLIECDLADTPGLMSVIRDVQPDETYNLGGFTAPGLSWDHVDEVRAINVDAVAAMLQALGERAGARFFQASSASVFEGADAIPQTERTHFAPKTPYGESKADAMALVRQARERGMHAVSGVLYNHESPLRGEGFVTRRISMAVARIAAGMQKTLELGDLDVARDWGWAPDYVRGMMLMVRADEPKDYLLATGISHWLRFFLMKAFAAAGIDDWSNYVISTADRKRSTDTNMMVGDCRAAVVELGWRHTVDLDAIAAIMVRHDQRLLVDPQALWTDF